MAIPLVYVRIPHEGISPEDAERLLVRPMEQELRNIEGLKELRATAIEGNATIVLEFEAGFDTDQALDDVREQVDVAKTDLPDDTDEPSVHEVNVALFPVIVVTLYGDVSERELVVRARSLRDKLEGLPGVLEADIAGDREDVLEVIVDSGLLESLGQGPDALLEFVARNNRLVAAGAMDTGQGRFPVKVPALFRTAEDLLSIPVAVSGDRVLTFADAAFGRRTFKDPTGFARVGGQPAIALEVSKRIGANIIDTIADVRALVEQERSEWPPGMRVHFSQDRSQDIRDMLRDLQSNVIAAIVLVMIVVVAALGLRTAGLVGISIPGSFLTGILVLGFAGLTINIVVLFSLIMAVGMLVDGTIVVVELADRRMAEGHPRRAAYAMAAKRMAWPIIAATATTLAAFMPLLFWPGVIGEFMKYLPVTLIATLAASLFMALVFVPTLGGAIGRRAPDSEFRIGNLTAAESGDLSRLTGGSRLYLEILRVAVTRPVAVVLLAAGLLTTAYAAYGHFGKGEEQRAAEAFLLKAFGAALFVMAIILVTQFNSFYQAALILSAVVLSTVGVLLGLLVTSQPFGIVMSGIGVIALAGIVVNNNIVLIDTYNILRRDGMDAIEAALRTGVLRLRPVLLTTVTTVLGLMPMVLGVNIDIIGRSVTVGGPSTQWWTQLATAVAGGLAFATLLTLMLTPSLLVLGERRRGRRSAPNSALEPRHA